MIVNYREEGWQIISQRAHGLLAGQLCFHWKKALRPQRWVETVIATAEHDDAFNEWDEDELLLNENGGPVNFVMRRFEREKCERLLHLALTKSSYIAALISRHIRFLHESSEDKAARKYCRDLKKLEEAWLNVSGIQAHELNQAYAILEWCDALSLLICRQMIQPLDRNIEISRGPDNRRYQLHAPDAQTLTVDPWPFEPDHFEIQYESKTIPQLRFNSEAEFREKLIKTTPELHSYQLAR